MQSPLGDSLSFVAKFIVKNQPNLLSKISQIYCQKSAKLYNKRKKIIVISGKEIENERI